MAFKASSHKNQAVPDSSSFLVSDPLMRGTRATLTTATTTRQIRDYAAFFFVALLVTVRLFCANFLFFKTSPSVPWPLLKTLARFSLVVLIRLRPARKTLNTLLQALRLRSPSTAPLPRSFLSVPRDYIENLA